MKKCMIFVLVMTCLIVSCSKEDSPKNGILCRCMLMNVSSLNYNYLIEITDSDTIRVSSGVLCGEVDSEILYEDSTLEGNLSEFNFFEEIKRVEQRQLSKDEQKLVYDCIADIENKKLKEFNSLVGEYWNDAWAVVMIIDDKKYVALHPPYEELLILFNILMELSPVDIRKETGISFRLKSVQERLKNGYDNIYEKYRDQILPKSCWERTKEWFD